MGNNFGKIPAWSLMYFLIFSPVQIIMRQLYEHRVLIVPNGTVKLGDWDLFGHLKMVTNTNF